MDELDSYSRTVSAVAAEITGKVAAVRIGHGSGSAVVTGEGVLLTNAHVVGDARGGRADFGDGTQAEVVVVRHRSAVGPRRAARGPPDELPAPVDAGRRRHARRRASSWWPSATRSAWPGRSPPAW